MNLPPLTSIPLILRPQAWLTVAIMARCSALSAGGGASRWRFIWSPCLSDIWNADARRSIRCYARW